MPLACACDACTAERPDLDAAGFCGFCAASCYPVATLGSREVRVALDRASRGALHGEANHAEVDGTPPPPPPPRRSSEDDPDFAYVARQIRRRVAHAAIDAAKPLTERAIAEGVKFFQKKLSGR
jgi:hypothetical protein